MRALSLSFMFVCLSCLMVLSLSRRRRPTQPRQRKRAVAVVDTDATTWRLRVRPVQRDLRLLSERGRRARHALADISADRSPACSSTAAPRGSACAKRGGERRSSATAFNRSSGTPSPISDSPHISTINPGIRPGRARSAGRSSDRELRPYGAVCLSRGTIRIGDRVEPAFSAGHDGHRTPVDLRKKLFVRVPD